MIQVAEARVLLLAVAIVIGGQSALAQAPQMNPSADSPILARNPAGPAELAQFDVVAGDWDMTVTIPRRSGPPYVYQAASHNHWIANGHVMMQEWREPDASGIELRSLNPVSRKWDGRSLYVPQPGTWYENEAELVGGDMIATRHSIASDGTPLIQREIYHSIDADRFEIRSEVSRDAGVSWRPGRFSLVATRRTH